MALESKTEKWRRITAGRVRSCGLALDNLRKMCNRETYEYPEEDVEKFLIFLRGKIDSIEESFKRGTETGEFFF